ncbi:MAG: hypothetical protein WD178_00505 [Actinomycetota bacterium]
MESPAPKGSGFQSSTRKSTRTLFYWTFTWVLSLALLAFGRKFLWDEMLAMTLVVFGILRRYR